MLSEINKISNLRLRGVVAYYYLTHGNKHFSVASTVRGKYHPVDEYRYGGLHKHTLRVFRVAEHLMEMDNNFTQDERDLILAACLIHDANKVTKNPRDENAGVKLVKNIIRDIPCSNGELLVELVAIHGGRFYPPGEYAYDPNNKLHRVLHTADYIASRNDIIVKLNVDGFNPRKVRWYHRFYKKLTNIVGWFH